MVLITSSTRSSLPPASASTTAPNGASMISASGKPTTRLPGSRGTGNQNAWYSALSRSPSAAARPSAITWCSGCCGLNGPPSSLITPCSMSGPAVLHEIDRLALHLGEHGGDLLKGGIELRRTRHRHGAAARITSAPKRNPLEKEELCWR